MVLCVNTLFSFTSRYSYPEKRLEGLKWSRVQLSFNLSSKFLNPAVIGYSPYLNHMSLVHYISKIKYVMVCLLKARTLFLLSVKLIFMKVVRNFHFLES